MEDFGRSRRAIQANLPQFAQEVESHVLEADVAMNDDGNNNIRMSSHWLELSLVCDLWLTVSDSMTTGVN
ncbi:hypothetical protein HanPI659440_Chr05g0207411 [Helianthus annuus]|nr:hypothetical protein HanLR1_Chr17g0655221 [Helianthus annuus]KAJ0789772.1 hypothetical protein HanPI659440_Chr05g0207411 [Helianthus annuus]